MSSPERRPDESFEDYKIRRAAMNVAKPQRAFFQHTVKRVGTRSADTKTEFSDRGEVRIVGGQFATDGNRRKRRALVDALGKRQFKKIYKKA